jgi:glucose/arabinose dehydrogenase
LRASVAILAVAALLLLGGAAQAAPPSLQLIEAAHDLSSPVFVASTSADPAAIYVVEQTGKIQRVVGDVTDSVPFLDISSTVHFEDDQGLLSMAFSPSYARDRRFFVDYVGDGQKITVAEFKARPGKPPKRVKTLFRIVHRMHQYHYGGQLQFGPDGRLYVSLGDSGCCGDPDNSAQNPKDKFGKLLRAAPPFAKWQIAGYGFRNPWRFSFDSATGDLYVADVGQDAWEEVDYRAVADLPTPANYGWSRYEGSHDYNTSRTVNPGPPTPLVFPIQEYAHGSGDCAITGGYVYRGTAMADEVGRYFYADFCTGTVWSMAAGGGDNRVESITVNAPSSFGVDTNGELYVAALGEGKVYRLSE